MTAQFDDGKEDGALRTIGEVSRALSIKTHVLRYWEQQFPMLEPLKRSGGRRYYRTEDVELIATINRLVNDEGYTLKGAQQAIENGKQGGTKPEVESPSAMDFEGVMTQSDPAKWVIDEKIAPASDGGVDSFFGKTSESEQLVEPEAEEVANQDSGPGMARDELLARLKSMRARLESALAV